MGCIRPVHFSRCLVSRLGSLSKAWELHPTDVDLCADSVSDGDFDVFSRSVVEQIEEMGLWCRNRWKRPKRRKPRQSGKFSKIQSFKYSVADTGK